MTSAFSCFLGAYTALEGAGTGLPLWALHLLFLLALYTALERAGTGLPR